MVSDSSQPRLIFYLKQYWNELYQRNSNVADRLTVLEDFLSNERAIDDFLDTGDLDNQIEDSVNLSDDPEEAEDVDKGSFIDWYLNEIQTELTRKQGEWSKCYKEGTLCLKCPKCNEDLNADSYTKVPKARRIIDFDERRILHLQHEFPAVLTHRLGLSVKLFNFIRPALPNSSKPSRISKLLREMHTLRHDVLQRQYLNAVEDFSRFDDKSKYVGHFPSPGYLGYVYTSSMRLYKHYIYKQMAVLPAEILKGDHSFKLPKKIGKTNSVSVFNAVYTVCNEYEEICMMYLTATKALSHLVQPFEQFYKSRSLYGNPKPKIFFRDNPLGDKSFLEKTIPSLLCGTSSEVTSPIPCYPPLPDIELPDYIAVHVVSTSTDINRISSTILSDVSIGEDGTGAPIYIGFDTEWPVFSVGASTRKPVAVIQIAYDDYLPFGLEVPFKNTLIFTGIAGGIVGLVYSNLAKEVATNAKSTDHEKLETKPNTGCTPFEYNLNDTKKKLHPMDDSLAVVIEQPLLEVNDGEREADKTKDDSPTVEERTLEKLEFTLNEVDCFSFALESSLVMNIPDINNNHMVQCVTDNKYIWKHNAILHAALSQDYPTHTNFVLKVLQSDISGSVIPEKYALLNKDTPSCDFNTPGNTVTKRKRISSKSALGSSSCRSEEEHEAEQRMIKNCISKAIQYYQTNDIALGNHNNLNSLGMRTAYNVEHVKKVTEDYFKTLVYGADDGTVDGNLTYKAMATQAYSNTVHIANMFLGVYCKDKYRVNGSCWSDYKKNDEHIIMVYMLERIVYYWNNNSSNPGVPSGSGRMSDLAAENPFLPLHLAMNNWIARNMIISLLGNTKKLVPHKPRSKCRIFWIHVRPHGCAQHEYHSRSPMAALNTNITISRSAESDTYLEHDFRPVYLEGGQDEQDQPAPSQNESFSVPGTDSVQSPHPSPSPSPSPRPSPSLSPSPRLSASVCLSPASLPPPPEPSTSSSKIDQRAEKRAAKKATTKRARDELIIEGRSRSKTKP
ncbi:uncharacterized protein EV154DRAFT_595118 [Mucor mucedo]|uniref:uncharacterized protein n=1 Tax=Mucor mucedo TaxID=29922 RepID=UPI0022207142|nr:uncharacterized protein EV154DRAFT_595118 [Mucor mucedo]KAI7887868.1 hypothetical protein EV154DRAFT_595118 [Mucor mucedo]